MNGRVPADSRPRLARAIFGGVLRSRSSRRATFMLFGIFIVIGAILFGLGYVTNPWAHPLPGRPALVGYWAGTLTFGPEDERAFALQLSQSGGRGVPGFNLSGRGRICGHGGTMDYRVGGRTKNFSGTRISFGLVSDSEPPGPRLGAIEGSWDGAELLQLRTRLYTVGTDGLGRAKVSAHAKKGNVDDQGDTIVFELRRSTEDAFKATC